MPPGFGYEDDRYRSCSKPHSESLNPKIEKIGDRPFGEYRLLCRDRLIRLVCPRARGQLNAFSLIPSQFVKFLSPKSFLDLISEK
jgi:hypothetical protein